MTSSLIDRLNAVSEQVALKRPVRVASTVNLTLSAFQTIDGVTPAASDENLRVLVKDQTTPSENGIYLMTTGSWERAVDFDGNRDVVKGTRVPVTEGNIGANKTYVVTAADPIVIDESGITFSEITESLVTSEFAKPRAPVSTLSSDTILTALDAGKQIDVDCTSADRVITLPAVSDPDLRNGDRITIRYAAGTNQVTIACQGSDGINGASSLALTSRYESLTLAADDSNWAVIGHARPFAAGSVVFIRAVSRTLLTPPVSPVPGARYVIAASGVPMGDWSSYANNDVIEANGQGGWIRYSPSESWHAYVEAENKVAFFTGTAWQGLPNTDDPAESTLGYALFQDQRSNGTDGGLGTAGTWSSRTIQTSVSNTISGCSLASNAITLPPGTFLLLANASFYRTGETQIRLKSTTTSITVYGPSTRIEPSASGDVVPLLAVLTLPASEAFRLEYFIESNPTTSALGRSTSAIGSSNESEVYASVQILDLSSLQGGKGDPGDIGPQGFAGFKYQYSNTVTEGEPAKGFIRLNNNTDFSLVTFAYIDAQSAEPGIPDNPDLTQEIVAWGTGGGILKIAKVGAEQNWITYDVQLGGVTLMPPTVPGQPAWLKLALAYRGHAGSFTNTDTVSVQFSAKGAAGATGSSFPIFDYTLGISTADADPGTGHLRLHTGNTFINIHETDRIVVDRAADIAQWDEDGGSLNRGYLYIVNATTAERIGVFKVTGSNSDQGNYVKINVSAISYTAPLADTRVALMFVPTGATGSVGGTTGTADNRLLRSDGLGGSVLQNSSITVDDSGNTAGIGNLTRTGYDTFAEQVPPSTPASNLVVLYPKSDGRLYEKDDAGAERGLSAIGKHTVWIPASAMTTRVTNGAASGTTEMTINKNMFKTLDFDAAIPEFAQFEIHLPKSWNLGTVTFQPVWSHAATSTNFGVVWALAGVARSDDDPGDVAFGTMQISADAGGTTNDIYIGPESSAVTITGSPAVGDTVQFQINRAVSDVGDTMTVDARLHGVRLFYTTNAATDS